MITSIIDKLIGTKSERFINKYQKILDEINGLEHQFSKLTGEEIREKIRNIREDIKIKNNADDYLVPVFALVREAAKRTIGHRHYDVQILGGIALYKGYISEMSTGEGKTLVATLPVVLKALSSQIHVITPNDYLAERDGIFMDQVYRYMGLSCGFISNKSSNEEESKKIKIFSEKDIIYVSNNQIVFYYLRHLLRPSNYTEHGLVRKFIQKNAIVDEIDNILIDESKTPFIIAAANNENAALLYETINKVIVTLQPEIHYNVVFKSHQVFLTDEGNNYLEQLLQEVNIIEHGLYDSDNNHILHIIKNLLKAHHLFRKDIEYVVRQGKVIIVDLNTGRYSEGRRFSKGLHQALEAKEGVEIREESETLLSMTYTDFFKEYEFLCGMTGTASTEKEEFLETYSLSIISIPSHRPKIRVDHEIRLYEKRDNQLKGLIELIKQKHHIEQPILVVTTNVQDSEIIDFLLKKEGIFCQLLNAKNHEKEAEFIANAGNLKIVTISTNMAGRGTDIKLGGNIDFQIDKMLLLSSEENENVDQEIDEEKIAEEEHLGDIRFEEMNLSANQKRKIKEILAAYEPIKEKVKSIGGLCVIAFGFPESEKIVLQAIGRAGRQGDPGESYSFFSLEDDVLKTSLQGSWNKFIFSQIFADGDEYVSGGPVLSTVRKLWAMMNAQHFRSRKDLNKYETVRSQQRKDFFAYRDVVLSTDNALELLKKCFEVFMKEDYQIYLLSMLQKKFKLQFETLQELEVLFYKQLENNYLDNDQLRESMLEILDDVWKQHIREVESIQYGSGLVAYAQKDPFHEFNVQISNMFQTSIRKYRLEFLTIFMTQDNPENLKNLEGNIKDKLQRLMGLMAKHKTKK